MAELAVGLYVLYFVLAVGLRSFLQWRATGKSGFVGLVGRPFSTEWVAGALFTVALAMGAAAPVLAIADVHEPLGALDGSAGNVAGLVLASAGLALTIYAQLAMGASWRIGVDPGERTELVVDGPFALVRNPIFTAMIPTAVGLALMVPSVLALAGLAVLFFSLELQVRVVEEPYLLQIQGSAYAEYASRTGRFLPRVGTLRHNPDL